MHWAKRKAIVDEWKNSIGWAFKTQKLPWPLPYPLTMTCTQFSKRNVRDADNAVTIAKLAGDALVSGGYLPDDSPEYIDTIILQSKKGKEDLVVITIQPHVV